MFCSSEIGMEVQDTVWRQETTSYAGPISADRRVELSVLAEL